MDSLYFIKVLSGLKAAGIFGEMNLKKRILFKIVIWNLVMLILQIKFGMDKAWFLEIGRAHV